MHARSRVDGHAAAAGDGGRHQGCPDLLTDRHPRRSDACRWPVACHGCGTTPVRRRTDRDRSNTGRSASVTGRGERRCPHGPCGCRRDRSSSDRRGPGTDPGCWRSDRESWCAGASGVAVRLHPFDTSRRVYRCMSPLGPCQGDPRLCRAARWLAPAARARQPRRQGRPTVPPSTTTPGDRPVRPRRFPGRSRAAAYGDGAAWHVGALRRAHPSVSLGRRVPCDRHARERRFRRVRPTARTAAFIARHGRPMRQTRRPLPPALGVGSDKLGSALRQAASRLSLLARDGARRTS